MSRTWTLVSRGLSGKAHRLFFALGGAVLAGFGAWFLWGALAPLLAA